MTRSFRLLSISAVLFALSCVALAQPPTPAPVEMDAGQVHALLELAAYYNNIGFSGWTQTSLQGACGTGPSVDGIKSCNGSGFVTDLHVENTFRTNLKAPPQAIAKLVALQRLTVKLGMSSSLPSSWSSLTQLETLEISQISSQSLSGAIPEEWSLMTRLKRLTIYFASYRPVASTPPSWLSQIEEIELHYGYWLNMELPSSWGSSTTLKSLKLHYCTFTGGLPDGITNNPIIETIWIQGDTKFAVGLPAPSDLSKMTRLQTFVAYYPAWVGQLPNAYPTLNFTTFSLVNAWYITGTIPQSLLDVPTIKTISLLSLSYLHGDMPGPSSTSTKLETLQVSSGGINGTISPRVSLVPMVYLDLPKTNGPFPLLTTTGPQSTTACNYTFLEVYDAQFTGSLPSELFQKCRNLQHISLLRNNLIGQLPDLDNLPPALFSITFNGNPFGGSLPSVINFNPAINRSIVFRAANCSLTGTVPPSLLKAKLRTLNLELNRLDLCSNAKAIKETGFYNTTLPAYANVCLIKQQTPSPCGCADVCGHLLATLAP